MARTEATFLPLSQSWPQSQRADGPSQVPILPEEPVSPTQTQPFWGDLRVSSSLGFLLCNRNDDNSEPFQDLQKAALYTFLSE